MGAEALLEIANVRHFYDVEQNSAQLCAVGPISLKMDEPEIVAIVGPSGCGKSTLLRIAAGLLSPTEGSVEVNGLSPQLANHDKSIAFVSQDPTLFPWLTVERNVSFPLEITGSNFDLKVPEFLNKVMLSGYEHLFPSQLSGGMKSRVALARALILSPKLMLMDEPFGALDELTSLQLCLELVRLWKDLKCSILVVTHSITQAVFLGHRVLVLSQRPGQIEAQFSVNLPRFRDNSTFTLTAFGAEVAKVRSKVRNVLQ